MDMSGSHPLTDKSQTFVGEKKYRKAIKEINKLITINTSLKKQLIIVQGQYDQLKENYSLLQQKYYTLQQNLQKMSLQDITLTAKLPTNHEQSYDIILSEDFKKNLGIQFNKKNQNYSPLSLKAKQLETTGTLSQYIDTKRKLQQIQQKLSEKQKQIKSINLKLQQKNDQNLQLTQKYQKLCNITGNNQKQLQVKNIEKLKILEKQKSQLELQLATQKQLTTKLKSQNQNIKKNMVSKLFTSQQSIVQIPKSMQINQSTNNSKNIGIGVRPAAVPYHQSYYTSSQSINNSLEKGQIKGDPFIQHYFKKIRDLENENIKLKKQNKEKKLKYKSLLTQLKEQLTLKDAQIKQINDFIIKQQDYIQSFCNQKNSHQFQEYSSKNQIQNNTYSTIQVDKINESQYGINYFQKLPKNQSFQTKKQLNQYNNFNRKFQSNESLIKRY